MLFHFSKDEFKELTKQNCFYCGCSPYQIKTTHNKVEEYIYNGLDRLDNTKGYTADNVVPCCGHCNKMKLQMTLEEFESQILAIAKYRNLI